jgi:hypothetical protein
VVVRVLDRLASQAPPDPPTGLFEAYESRAADALVQLASERLGAEAEPDRACVVVHLDGAVLGGQAGAPPDAGAAHLEDGPALAVSTARRLACDARVQRIWDGADGQPMGVGRATRQVPAWLLRQLRRRDEGCVFPGCGRTRWVHAHHLVHWADGGATDADNLALLCGFHHRVSTNRGGPSPAIPLGASASPAPTGDRWRVDRRACAERSSPDSTSCSRPACGHRLRQRSLTPRDDVSESTGRIWSVKSGWRAAPPAWPGSAR